MMTWRPMSSASTPGGAAVRRVRPSTCFNSLPGLGHPYAGVHGYLPEHRMGIAVNVHRPKCSGSGTGGSACAAMSKWERQYAIAAAWAAVGIS